MVEYNKNWKREIDYLIPFVVDTLEFVWCCILLWWILIVAVIVAMYLGWLAIITPDMTGTYFIISLVVMLFGSLAQGKRGY